MFSNSSLVFIIYIFRFSYSSTYKYNEVIARIYTKSRPCVSIHTSSCVCMIEFPLFLLLCSININVVSDPEGETTGEEEECQELGTHMLNLIEVKERNTL